MHPPRYSTSLQRLYCSHFCDTGNKQCPSDDYKYTDIHTNFLCSNNFFNLYYKCFNKDESINNEKYAGLFFSAFLWTPTIYIDLGVEYKEFAIEFWYFPDDRLRQKRYPAPVKEYKPDKHDKPENEPKRIIFMSDCCKVVVGDSDSGSDQTLKFFDRGSKSYVSPSASRIIHTIDYHNWNHFVLTYFYALEHDHYTYYLTYKNEQFYYCGEKINDQSSIKIKYGYWKDSHDVKLSQIIFCSFDDKVDYGRGDIEDTFKKECKEAEWLDGFYRKLQIFDLTYSTKHPVFYSHEFEDDGLNDMIKHRYIYKLDSIVDNKLIDLIGGKHGDVRAYDIMAEQNPDETNYILYESNYSPNGGIPTWGSAQYVDSYVYKPPEIEITPDIEANSKCEIIQKNKYCLSCKKEYSLFSKECLGEVNTESKPATYFYKNPGKNMPERLSLNIDFDKIKTSPYFTFFFFIKIYGFVKDNPISKDGFVKLIIFHEETDSKGNIIEQFYLAWTPDRNQNEKMFFFHNQDKLFSYDYFREYNFGQWIPISFAAFRENDRLFQLNMAQASILYQNLYKDAEYKGGYYPYVKFTQFTITNYWVGLLGDVKVYNRFIANAWGIIKYQHYTIAYSGDQEGANDDIPDSAITEIDLKSDRSDSCLLSTQILNQPASNYKIECVIDNNPHFFRCPGGMEEQTVRYHQGDGYYGNCTACCGNARALDRCLGGHDQPCGSRYYDDHSCETQSPVWKQWFPYSDSNGRIRCGEVEYIDYNRFKYAKVEKVSSPQDVWAIDFWFYTGTCHAAVKRTGEYTWAGSNRNGNNNNFKEFTMVWNYHIRIKVYTVKEDDVPTNNVYHYYADCTPLVVLEHPDLNSPEIYQINLLNRHYRWTFVACGVNFQEKIFYETKTNRFSSEIPFTSKLVTVPDSYTQFVFNENSPSGYGFTFVHQLRLWHCYNCAHNFRNLYYVSTDKNFNAVYHNFDGVNNNDAYPTVSFYDSAGRSGSYSMYQAADFPGYTVRYWYGDPVLCDETLYNYYDEGTDSCQRHYNLARMPTNFEMPSIASSRNARYTIDFWFFVENSAELSPGLNVLWKYHMSITLLRDTANKNTINAICFPQSYRDDVDGIGGQEIIDLYDKALNKDKYAFYQGSSKWNFVRCAVDQTRKIFFINDNLQLDLEGEILYGTTRNYRPFRYFKINAKHPLKFQNAHDNPTRIFLRNIRCYKDFIDFRLMDMRFIRCGINNTRLGGWDWCNYWPLSLCFDYSDNYVHANWPCTYARSCFTCPGRIDCGLPYFLNDEDSDQQVYMHFHRWRDLSYFSRYLFT